MKKLIADNVSLLARCLVEGSLTREQVMTLIDPSVAVRKARKNSLGFENWTIEKRIISGRSHWSNCLLVQARNIGYIALRGDKWQLTVKGLHRLIREHPEAFTGDALESIPEPLRTVMDRCVGVIARKELEEHQTRGMRMALKVMLDYCLEIGCFSDQVCLEKVYEQNGEA